ncbi:putative protein [Arabidopsis thaliana]|nr:putative protein [Arabidopsis thaliana]CAB80352.1 putative protein [Arabidopsis thaliana]
MEFLLFLGCITVFLYAGKGLLLPMGWLTKILKGSSHKFSDGQCNGRYREDRNLEGPRYSAEGSDFDKEEIECAIALSLSEQEHVIPQDDKGKKIIEYKSETEEDDDDDEDEDEEYMRAQLEAAEEEERRVAQAQIEEEEKRRAEAQLEETEKLLAKARLEEEEMRRSKAQLEEDELLAKALQESMNVGSPPRYDPGNILQPYPFLIPSSHRICVGCQAEIGHGRFLSAWVAFGILNVSVAMHIPTNPAGLIEYRAHPFWMQKYCPSHERDGTPRCCSCERMEPKDTKYLILDDGRKLCLECLDSAIMDTHECQPLYLEIREFYEGLHMKVEQSNSYAFGGEISSKRAMEGEKHGHHHLPETRGLCLSEEQTVTTVLRRPRIGAGYKLIDMITEPCRLIRRCEVTAILILYGLPRLLTGSILAHEMMHAWLRLNGYPNLRPEVEEGICQVLAHMWLESETYAGSTLVDIASSSSSAVVSASSKKGERSDFEKKLGEFFKHQIESDSSSAYGDGFRQGNQAVLKHGLRRTLDHIRLTGTFPKWI